MCAAWIVGAAPGLAPESGGAHPVSAGKGTAHECVLDRDCTICRGISPSEPHRLASPAQCLTANDTPRFAGRQSPQQWQHTGADASLLLCGMYTCREPMLLCKAILPWLHQTSYMSYRLCAAQACCAPSPLATMPSSSSAWQADSSLQLACLCCSLGRMQRCLQLLHAHCHGAVSVTPAFQLSLQV